MIKLQTQVGVEPLSVGVSYGDRILVLGSCFADSIGRSLENAGFDVMVNPFGTLYNPASICNAVSRLRCGAPFTREDVVEMGAGAGLFCSFSHHTSFAQNTPEAFLSEANAALEAASAFWQGCNKVLITLGSAFVWQHDGEVVANCLKRPEGEFRRDRLGTGEVAALLERLVIRSEGKQFIFTVSPVRYLRDGAHGNALSKAALLLAVDNVCTAHPDRCAYFPACEILLDELRDYRFYAEDLVHPSLQAEHYIFERFIDATLPGEERERFITQCRNYARAQHVPGRKKPDNYA